VPIILIDVNIEGHSAQVWRRLQSAQWADLTTDLDVQFRTFREVGLDPSSPDDVVWQFCQTQGTTC
jgi:hypothetical protein